MPDDELAIQSRADDLVELYARARIGARAWLIEQLEASGDPAAAIAIDTIRRRWPSSRAGPRSAGPEAREA